MSKQIDKYSYNPEDLLGIGSIGKVVKAYDAKKQSYALRIIKKDIITDDEGMRGALLDEIRLMQKLDHPKIVKLIEVIESDNNYYVVMELCTKDLQTYLQQIHKMPESECLKLLVDILGGFTELIQHGIMHRALKLSNILKKDDSYKLSDCGFQKCLDNFKKDQSQKDEDFKFNSPQVLSNSKYSNKCDIWSLGMVLYNVLFGYTAWSGQKLEQLLYNIEHKLLEFPEDQTIISDSMKSFIEGCLAIEESERMNWDDVFQHPLVKNKFPNYQTNIKEEQIKFLMNEVRQKIIKQKINISKLFEELDENGDETLQFSELVVLLHKIDKTLSRQDCQIIFKQLDLDGDKTVSFEEFTKWLTDNNSKMTIVTGKFKGKQIIQKPTPSSKYISTQPNQQNQWPKQNYQDSPGLQQFGMGQSQSVPNLNQSLNKQIYLDPEMLIFKLKQTIQKYNINVHDLFIKFDIDQDGLLNYQEFATMIIRINRNIQPQELQIVFKLFDINDDNFISFIEFRQILNITIDKRQGIQMLSTIQNIPQIQQNQQYQYQQQMLPNQNYASQQRLQPYQNIY